MNQVNEVQLENPDLLVQWDNPVNVDNQDHAVSQVKMANLDQKVLLVTAVQWACKVPTAKTVIWDHLVQLVSPALEVFLDDQASKVHVVNQVLMDLLVTMDDLVQLVHLVHRDDLDKSVSLVRRVAEEMTVNLVSREPMANLVHLVPQVNLEKADQLDPPVQMV